VLERSVNQVIGAVPGADMASVSVLRGNAAETVASTSEQYGRSTRSSMRPGRDRAWRRPAPGSSFGVGVAEARERWPAFARSARAAGVESFLSAPLFIDEEFAGSLNL
jgi:hypothetical protein